VIQQLPSDKCRIDGGGSIVLQLKEKTSL
jgi:hypothetical protein